MRLLFPVHQVTFENLENHAIENDISLLRLRRNRSDKTYLQLFLHNMHQFNICRRNSVQCGWKEIFKTENSQARYSGQQYTKKILKNVLLLLMLII